MLIFIADYFIDSGLTVERFEKDGYPSVVVTKHGTKKPKIFLNGHFDMVEGEDHQFEPKIEGDRLYGRGTFDMQSGVAVLMTIMKEMAKTDHDVGLMLTGDEEPGGFRGAGYVMEFNYDAEIAIIPDGGMAVNRILKAEKGVLRFTLEAHGKRAHAAYPWIAENAIDRLVDAVQKAQATFTPIEDHPEDHWVTNASVTQFNSGVGTNVVPESASAYFDVRYIPGDDPEEIMDRIRKVLPKGVELKHLFTEPATSLDLEHPHVEAYVRAVEKHGRQAEFVGAMAASDSRFFAARGVPSILSQPDGGGHHGPYEWVDIPSIGLYYDILKTYLDEMAR